MPLLAQLTYFGIELSSMQWTLLAVTLVFGFYMAWGIGANDVANAMGTSVGSGALTLRRAVLVAAVLEFSGAFFAGSHVAETIRGRIVSPDVFAGEPMVLALGMLASLLAAGAWLQLATYCGWPVSTTHSIVGAIVGFGAVYGGLGAVNWIGPGGVASIATSWVISPLLAGVVSYVIFRLLLHLIFYSEHPVDKAKKVTPYLVAVVFFILTLAMVFKGLKNVMPEYTFAEASVVAAAVGIVAGVVSKLLVHRMHTGELPPLRNPQGMFMARSLRKARKHLERIRTTARGDAADRAARVLADIEQLAKAPEFREPAKAELDAHYRSVERLFAYLQVLSACFVAFAHGANDVANAIGPMASTIDIIISQKTNETSQVATWVLVFGGVGIIIGIATWGWRVIETVGRRITELTPSRGFAAEFGAATTIVLASKMGLPISTTHTLVGAILGVGLARGISALNLNTLRDIVASWLITLPAGAGLAIVFFYGLRLIFL